MTPRDRREAELHGASLAAKASLEMIEKAKGDPSVLRSMIVGALSTMSRALEIADNPGFSAWSKRQQAKEGSDAVG